MSKPKLTDIVLLLLSLALCLGVKLVFHACGMKEDGSYMNCHWAEQAVFAVSAGLTITSVLRLFLDRKAKAGAALAMSVTATFTALIPGVCIRLCMMDTMRCHAVMRPAVIILCGMLSLTGIADFVLGRKED